MELSRIALLPDDLDRIRWIVLGACRRVRVLGRRHQFLHLVLQGVSLLGQRLILLLKIVDLLALLVNCRHICRTFLLPVVPRVLKIIQSGVQAGLGGRDQGLGRRDAPDGIPVGHHLGVVRLARLIDLFAESFDVTGKFHDLLFLAFQFDDRLTCRLL